MNILEKRISKIERKVLEKKHHGVFIIIKENDLYIINNFEDKGKTFDKINELAEKNCLSFNSVINQIIEFGLKNIETK